MTRRRRRTWPQWKMASSRWKMHRLCPEAELPVGAVEAFAAGEPLNLREVCDGIEGDEVVENQVAARDGAVGVGLVEGHGQLVPRLQEGLDLL